MSIVMQVRINGQDFQLQHYQGGARNKKSMWTNDEEMKCNGISVKWCDGSAASGHLMPIIPVILPVKSVLDLDKFPLLSGLPDHFSRKTMAYLVAHVLKVQMLACVQGPKYGSAHSNSILVTKSTLRR